MESTYTSRPARQATLATDDWTLTLIEYEPLDIALIANQLVDTEDDELEDAIREGLDLVDVLINSRDVDDDLWLKGKAAWDRIRAATEALDEPDLDPFGHDDA